MMICLHNSRLASGPSYMGSMQHRWPGLWTRVRLTGMKRVLRGLAVITLAAPPTTPETRNGRTTESRATRQRTHTTDTVTCPFPPQKGFV